MSDDRDVTLNNLVLALEELKKSDPVFELLPKVLLERVRILIDRGRRYNRPGSGGVMRQIYYATDQSALHRIYDPVNRLKAICTLSTEPQQGIEDLIRDAANYTDMWACCRLHTQTEGKSDVETIPDESVGSGGNSPIT